MGHILNLLDLCGTFVFALSGGATGVKNRLDLFGVLVLSFAAANTGGIVRDLLIGVTPPPAISDWKHVAVSLLAGLIAFYRYPLIDRLRSPVLLLDAAGLALFSVSGSLKALQFGLGPMGALMLGLCTGIGGGMARDLLVAQTPIVLRAELYAVAALAGSVVVVGGRLLHVSSTLLAIAAAATCFGIRMMAIRRGWKLPVASHSDG